MLATWSNSILPTKAQEVSRDKGIIMLWLVRINTTDGHTLPRGLFYWLHKLSINHRSQTACLRRLWQADTQTQMTPSHTGTWTQLWSNKICVCVCERESRNRHRKNKNYGTWHSQERKWKGWQKMAVNSTKIACVGIQISHNLKETSRKPFTHHVLSNTSQLGRQIST